MSLIDVSLILILGLIIGAPMSIVGLGGGLLIVPILILFFGLPAKNAVAISIMAMMGTTFSASISYIRQGRVDYMLGLLYDVLDLPGVIFGAYLTTIFPKNILVGLCGLFIMSISLLLIRHRGNAFSIENIKQSNDMGWKRIKKDAMNQIFEYTIRKPSLALLSSFASGLVTGLAGLGGGVTDTTTMILLGVPPHIAVATSEFAMALTNGMGILAHGILQNICWDYAVPLTVGTFLGAQIGASVARHIKGENLTKALSAIAFILGLRLILQSFGI